MTTADPVRHPAVPPSSGHGHPHHASVTDAHSSQPEPAPDERRSWSVLAVALIAQILVVLDISVVNTALPTIGADLHLAGAEMQWLITAYLLVSGGGLLLGGRIADLLPRRLVFLIGLMVFTTASLIGGFAASAGVLITTRAAQGLGAALMTPAALSLVMTTYAGSQRTKGLALWGAVGSIGITAGVLLGGALTSLAGWQLIFWINVPIGAAAIIAALVVVPRVKGTGTGLAQIDLAGAITAILGLGALVLGIEGAATHGWTSPRTLAFLALSAGLLVAFGVVERRVRRPLVPPHTWRIRTLTAGTAVMLGVTGLLVGAIFLSSIFVQTVLHYSAVQAGIAFLPLALMITAGTKVAGHLLGHTSPRTIAACGLAAGAAGALLLSAAGADAGYALNLLPGLLLLGAGVGVVFVAVSVTAMAGIPAHHAGMASGFLMTGHEIGAALGVAVLSAIASTAGNLATNEGAATGFSRGFVAAAILAVALAGIAYRTMPAHRTTGHAGLHMH